MGIGYIIVVRNRDAGTALDTLKALRAGPRVIGEVKQGSGKVTLTDG
jgi:phosphoribosylaminoimidazole (AIR) synthetase